MDALDVIVGAILGAAGGVVAVFTGLSSFLGRIWADRILEAERAKHGRDLERLRTELEAGLRRIQGEIDRTILVHRVHFETEFRALSDIWQKVARLRAVFSLLRPLDEAKPETRETFETVSKAVGELVDAIDSQSPFYPKDIYTELDALRVMAKIELSEVATERPDTVPDWAQRRRERWNELKGCVNVISDKIRERLGRLTVVSEGKNQ